MNASRFVQLISPTRLRFVTRRPDFERVTTVRIEAHPEALALIGAEIPFDDAKRADLAALAFVYGASCVRR